MIRLLDDAIRLAVKAIRPIESEFVQLRYIWGPTETASDGFAVSVSHRDNGPGGTGMSCRAWVPSEGSKKQHRLPEGSTLTIPRRSFEVWAGSNGCSLRSRPKSILLEADGVAIKLPVLENQQPFEPRPVGHKEWMHLFPSMDVSKGIRCVSWSAEDPATRRLLLSTVVIEGVGRGGQIVVSSTSGNSHCRYLVKKPYSMAPGKLMIAVSDAAAMSSVDFESFHVGMDGDSGEPNHLRFRASSGRDYEIRLLAGKYPDIDGMVGPKIASIMDSTIEVDCSAFINALLKTQAVMYNTSSQDLVAQIGYSKEESTVTISCSSQSDQAKVDFSVPAHDDDPDDDTVVPGRFRVSQMLSMLRSMNADWVGIHIAKQELGVCSDSEHSTRVAFITGMAE